MLTQPTTTLIFSNYPGGGKANATSVQRFKTLYTHGKKSSRHKIIKNTIFIHFLEVPFVHKNFKISWVIIESITSDPARWTELYSVYFARLLRIFLVCSEIINSL
jgi:hypothetical protein